MISGQGSVSVSVHRRQPGLDGTKKLAKPLQKAEDLVQGSSVHVAARESFFEKLFEFECLLQRHAKSAATEAKVLAYPNDAPAKL